MSLLSKLLICLLLTLLFIFPRPTLALVSNGPLLFSDDFSSGNLNGWTILNGNWNVVNGQLVGNLPGYNLTGRIFQNSGSEWDDYAIELDVNNTLGVDEGIGFRRIGNTAYEFNLRHGTGSFGTPEVKFFKAVSGVAQVIYSTRNLELLNNKTYHIRIEAVRDNFKLYINNIKIVDYTDPNTVIKKGSITLATNSGSFGSDNVKFDNLKIYSLSSPIPSSSPTPSPFLDLPWDYQGKGLSFNEAALLMTSFFDHQFPLLSSGMKEPEINSGNILKFNNILSIVDPYSSHDGYDWGTRAKANISDPILAAASGTATYINSCGACGNMILIDHHNGYQTRYLHMQKDGLITNTPGQKVEVISGQQIGKVGATGNVSPPGDAGAHIHFGVFQDKDSDGNFENNIPDGVTDPFGWQSKEIDPWENFSFSYAGRERIGNKSFYLWKNKLDNLDSTLNSNGGIFKTERSYFNFPQNTVNQNLNLNIKSAPLVKASDILESIGSTIIATAADSLGNLITTFQSFYTLTIDFKNFDLSRFKTDTISIYSSEDGINWKKETTQVDLNNKTASALLNHMTHFALMAERLDTTAPVTTAALTGEQGQTNWFKSDVNIALSSADNSGGLGTDYTMYRKEGEDWEIYTTPLSFTNEGHYKIEFYSADKDENLEVIKTVEFDIDKTIPEAKIFIDQNIPDLVVQGIDQNLDKVERQENMDTKKSDDTLFLISDLAGNTLRLDIRDNDKEKNDKFKIFSLSYNDQIKSEIVDNNYNVKYKGKESEKIVEEQSFEIKSEVKIKIKFDKEKNQSTIVKKVTEQEKSEEIKDGLIILQLITNKGNLEYSY